MRNFSLVYVMTTVGLLIVLGIAKLTWAQAQPPEPLEHPAPRRTADAILADYAAVVVPPFDQNRREDQAYIQQYIAERQTADQKRHALAKELFDAYPDHPRTFELMQGRWMSMIYSDYQAMRDETQAFLDSQPQSPHRSEVETLRVQAALRNSRANPEQMEAAVAEVEAFIAAHPNDPQSASMMMGLAETRRDPQERMAGYRRVVDAYPDDRWGKMAAGKIRMLEGVGKPFELAFDDAITGKRIDMADLRGQVVVIDFWATWCGPCIAEMPHMKELYAQYHDKGVEFIGVSLDQPAEQGGLDALKKYVAEKQIPWPQYYQGKGWESDFSSRWGINGIPTLFIIDTAGNLHSTEARGQLERLIPELLAAKVGAPG